MVLYICFSTGKKSIKELRRLCLQLKDEVFANPKFGISYNSEALEKMLINALGPEMRMGDITHPKYVCNTSHTLNLCILFFM